MRYCVAFAFAICSVNVAFAVPIHFLVAEPPQHRVHDDSYIIVIDSADDARLNHARALFGWEQNGYFRQGLAECRGRQTCCGIFPVAASTASSETSDQ